MLKQMHELHQYLLRLQEAGYLAEVDSRRVFLNYSELYEQNTRFWKLAILPMLGNSRFVLIFLSVIVNAGYVKAILPITGLL